MENFDTVGGFFSLSEETKLRWSMLVITNFREIVFLTHLSLLLCVSAIRFRSQDRQRLYIQTKNIMKVKQISMTKSKYQKCPLT